MPVSNAWNENVPADTDVLSLGDDSIRQFKLDIRQRLQQGGQLMQDSLSTDGLHAVNAGGAGIGPDIYKSDKATKLVTWADAGATMVAGSNWIGGNVTTGADPGHLHTGVIAVRVSGALVAGRIKASFRVPTRGALTFTVVKVSAVVFASPATQALRVNVVRIAAPALNTDPNSGGTSIFTVVGDRPSIAIGNFRVAPVAPTGTATFNAGDEMVFEIDNTGFTAAADLTIQCDVQ